MKKIDSLQFSRAVAALAVVFYHATVICAGHTGISPLGGGFLFGFRGVDLFFVLSGFIIASVHHTDLGRPERLGRYVFNRVSRIYPAVIIMTIASTIVYALGFGGADKSAKVTLSNFITSILILPQAGLPLVNVTWTLKYEMFFYVCFGLAIVNLRLGILLLAAWQTATLAAMLAHAYQPVSIWNYFLQPITLDFGIGICTALLFLRLESRQVLLPAAMLRLAFASASLILVALCLAPPPLLNRYDAVVSLLFGLASGVFLITLALLERRAQLRVAGFWVALGDASYSIYIVHFSVISLLAALFFKLGLPFGIPVFFALACAGIFAGMMFHRWIDAPIHRRLRRLRSQSK